MTEGPTARLIAEKITKKFGNERIVSVLSKKKNFDGSMFVGKTFSHAETIGKNIFLVFKNFGTAIRLHLMMWGAVHIYLLDENLRKDERFVRLILFGRKRKLVVYNAPIIEAISLKSLADWRNSVFDPFNRWDEKELLKKIEGLDCSIEELLLNQSLFAGIGNILKNEILFRAKVHPYSKVSAIPAKKLAEIIEIAGSLTFRFYEQKKKSGRIKPLLNVYRRANQKCFVCNSKIKMFRSKFTGRINFVCERCQKLYKDLSAKP